MATTNNQTLDLFNSLMHKLGVGELSAKESTDEQLKIDVLKGEIFRREKPKIGIVGKIRAGKSELGNAIFGKKAFEAGKELELTKEVSSKTLSSGIIIYDTPGFEGFSNYEEKTRDLMSECDLLLHVIRYPGALDKGAVRFYEDEIKPLSKPTVTVVNINKGEPLTSSEAVFNKAVDALKLPNMVYVYAMKDEHTTEGIVLKNIENLVIKMVDNLPEKHLVVFQDALSGQLQRKTKQYSVYHQSINAAAAASCASIVENFSDANVKAKINKIMLLTIGLILKVASIYESDFQAGTDVQKSTMDLLDSRYQQIIVEVPDGLAVSIGGVVAGALGAASTQTPAIAALLATVGFVVSGPIALVISAVVMGGLGGLLLSAMKRKYRTDRIPKLGGFDVAISVLSYGYASLATISAQLDKKTAPKDSLQFFSNMYKKSYDYTIRDALYTHKDILDNATEGDRAKILSILSNNIELRQIFVNVNHDSMGKDFGNNGV